MAKKKNFLTTQFGLSDSWSTNDQLLAFRLLYLILVFKIKCVDNYLKQGFIKICDKVMSTPDVIQSWSSFEKHTPGCTKILQRIQELIPLLANLEDTFAEVLAGQVVKFIGDLKGKAGTLEVYLARELNVKMVDYIVDRTTLDGGFFMKSEENLRSLILSVLYNEELMFFRFRTTPNDISLIASKMKAYYVQKGQTVEDWVLPYNFKVTSAEGLIKFCGVSLEKEDTYAVIVHYEAYPKK